MAAKNREELLNLIPAYAVGALDDAERVEFEAWLHHDHEAQSLLAEYQAVADHLVMLAPLRTAPDHLQADLRQRLTASSQPREMAAIPAKQPPKITGKPRSRRTSWALAAAAVLVITIASVILMQSGSDDPAPKPSAEQLYTELAAQPDAGQYAIVPGEVDDAVSGSLLVSADGKQAVLRVAYLPPITSDQTFQMWLVDNTGTRSSAGLFQAAQSQEAHYIEVPLDRPIADYQGIGVSLEPGGGSPYSDKPSGPRVLSVPLT